MSKTVYPDDYPKTRSEALRALASVKEEDIDYSDIPELTDEQLAQFRPVGDRFRKMAERNMIYLNKIIREHEERLAHEAKTL